MEPIHPSRLSSGGPNRIAVLPWGRITGYFFASRFFIYMIGMMSVHVITKGPAAQNRSALDLFKNWDANWYLRIATEGYLPTKEGVWSTAFFPLYPLLLHLAGFLFHDLRVAGYFISNVLLLASCLVFWKLVARDYGRENIADRAVLFFLFCPVSFFYSTIYSESLFFFLMVALVYLATERRWLAAGCCGYLAALTRPVGILLVVVLAAEFIAVWQEHRRNGGRGAPPLPAATLPFVASVLLTGAGLATYSLYLASRFGDPLEFLKAQAHWNRHLTFPWVPFERFLYAGFYDVWFYAAVVIGLVTLIAGLKLRLRESHLLLCLAFFLLYLSTSQLESIPRFLSVLFPFYITIALFAVRFPRGEPLLLAGSVMLLTLSTLLFVNGYWFT